MVSRSQQILSWKVPSREVEKSLRQKQAAAEASLPDDATKEEEEARSTLRQKRQISTEML